MEPLVIILVPGILGGLAIAAAFVLLQRRGLRRPSHSTHLQPVSTDMINMASIKVAGVGGLGLVAMAVAVALGVPRIGESMVVGIGLGAVGAVVVILRRRRTGAMPSSGRGLGANTTLRIDVPDEPTPAERSTNGIDCSLAPAAR